MIKVGIVGTGYTIGIAGVHIEGFKLQKDVKIVAIYDVIEGRAEDYINKYELEGAKACSSYEELLELVDAVTICTPNSSHISLSMQALQAGKHVLCEKPFAPTAEECEVIVEMEKRTDKVCMIGLCYQNIPGFMYMKELLDAKALGEIYYVRQSLGGGRIANPDVKCEWRMQKELSGAGAVADFGSHMLDMVDMLLREDCGPISEVQCMQGTFIQQRQMVDDIALKAVENEDVGVFNARLKKGTLVSFTTSRIGCDHTMEIYGSNGYMAFNGDKPFEIVLQLKNENNGAKKVIEVPEKIYKVSSEVPVVPFLINFYFQAKEFLECIKSDKVPRATFARGMYIQKLLDSLQVSAETKKVVEITFEE